MTTLTMQFSNDDNGDLFTLGVTGCEECPKYAVGLFAPVDDEGLFALCYEHMGDVSPLAASVLLGMDVLECGGEMTPLQLMLVDELGTCPACGSGLDTGAGFGMRDLECGDVCVGEAYEGMTGEMVGGCDCGGHDEDAHCGWSGSYPIKLYREKLMAKHLEGLVREHEVERMALRAELGAAQATIGDLLAQSNDHAERLNLLEVSHPDVLLWGRIRAFERKMEKWAREVVEVLDARTANAQLSAEALPEADRGDGKAPRGAQSSRGSGRRPVGADAAAIRKGQPEDEWPRARSRGSRRGRGGEALMVPCHRCGEAVDWNGGWHLTLGEVKSPVVTPLRLCARCGRDAPGMARGEKGGDAGSCEGSTWVVRGPRAEFGE